MPGTMAGGLLVIPGSGQVKIVNAIPAANPIMKESFSTNLFLKEAAAPVHLEVFRRRSGSSVPAVWNRNKFTCFFELIHRMNPLHPMNQEVLTR